MKRITQLCLTRIHWEHRLILFPLVSGDGDFLMNQERFLKHLVSFSLPSAISFKSKIFFFSFFPGSINDKSLFRLTPVIFVQLVPLFTLAHFDAQTHFIISFVCLRRPCLSELISGREVERSMQSVVMTPAQTLLNNWTDTFPLQFVEHSFRQRWQTLALISVALSDATSMRIYPHELCMPLQISTVIMFYYRSCFGLSGVLEVKVNFMLRQC